MAIPKRNASIPGTYFVTSRTWESRVLFTKSLPGEIFVRSLLEYRDRGVYLLHSFVLMPDHFHILLTPAATLERAVMHIKGGSAKRIREELNYRFPVWQKGFSDHRVWDAEDYDIRLNYLNQNPVRRGLVATAEEYSWASAGGKFPLDEVPQRLKPPAAGVRYGTAKAVP